MERNEFNNNGTTKLLSVTYLENFNYKLDDKVLAASFPRRLQICRKAATRLIVAKAKVLAPKTLSRVINKFETRLTPGHTHLVPDKRRNK